MKMATKTMHISDTVFINFMIKIKQNRLLQNTTKLIYEASSNKDQDAYFCYTMYKS